jgi:hypothetical protein
VVSFSCGNGFNGLQNACADKQMKAIATALLVTALCISNALCGRDNRVSQDSSSPAGQQPGSGLGAGNQTGANTGVQGKTATGAGAGAVGGVRGKSGDTGKNEDARDSEKKNAGAGAKQRP